LRIAFVVSEPLDKSGSIGVRVRVSELAKGLTRKGASVIIFNPFASRTYEIEDVRAMSFDTLHTSSLGKTALFSIAHRSLQSRIGQHLLLNEHAIRKITEFLSARIVAALKGSDVSLLQGEQDIAGLACIRAKQQLGIPVVTDLHGIWAEEIRFKNPSLRNSLLGATSEIVNESNLVLVVSKTMKDYLVNTFGASPTKIEIIPNASFLPAMTKTMRSDKASSVVYAGSLEPSENVELYVKSVPFVAQKFPQVKFYIIGHGRMKGYLKNLSLKIGASITFIQTLPHDVLLNTLCRFDVGVIPTKYAVAMPLKLFDYMSIGLPFVVSKGTECAKFVAEGDYGLIADHDPMAFGEAIMKLLLDKKLASSYSLKCLEAIREKHNWDAVADKLINIYHKLPLSGVR